MSITTFKTAEDAAKWVSKNLVTIEEGDHKGEFAIKESFDLDASLSKTSSNHAKAIGESKKYQDRAQKVEKEYAELKASFEITSAELEGLKAISGDAGKSLQELNKKNSDLSVKYNEAVKAKLELEAKIAELPKLQGEIERYKAETSKTKILDELRRSCDKVKVPKSVIDNLERLALPDFEIDESGKVWAKGETPQSVENYIAAQQKNNELWRPPSQSSGSQPGNTNPTQPVSLSGMFTP